MAVKEALCWIAQEALHNTFKEAEPGRVELGLEQADEEIVLEVRDDGKGFDTAGAFPGIYVVDVTSSSPEAARTVTRKPAANAGGRTSSP